MGNFKCKYCGKPYAKKGCLDNHEKKCESRPGPKNGKKKVANGKQVKALERRLKKAEKTICRIVKHLQRGKKIV